MLRQVFVDSQVKLRGLGSQVTLRQVLIGSQVRLRQVFVGGQVRLTQVLVVSQVGLRLGYVGS